jgi:hypothetical protein
MPTAAADEAAAADEELEVQVNGIGGPRCALMASLGWSVCQLRQAVAERLGSNPQLLRLVADGAVLDLEQPLSKFQREGPLVLSVVEVDMIQVYEVTGAGDACGSCFNGLYIQYDEDVFRQMNGPGMILRTSSKPSRWIIRACGQRRGDFDVYISAEGFDKYVPNDGWAVVPSLKRDESFYLPPPSLTARLESKDVLCQQFSLPGSCAIRLGLKVEILKLDYDPEIETLLWTEKHMSSGGKTGTLVVYEDNRSYSSTVQDYVLVEMETGDHLWFPKNLCTTCISWMKESEAERTKPTVPRLSWFGCDATANEISTATWTPMSPDSKLEVGQFGS